MKFMKFMEKLFVHGSQFQFVDFCLLVVYKIDKESWENMKKLMIVFFVSFFASMSFIILSADVLATPDHNSFYNRHKDEIQNGSSFYIQAKRDIAIVDYPGSSNVIGVVEEGRVLHLHYFYIDEHNEYWGMQVIDDSTCAWFKMKYVSEFYWNFSFQMEHEKEFKKPANEIIDFEGDGWIVLWEYPGSDMVSAAILVSDTKDLQYPIRAGYAYTDSKGVRWVTIRFRGEYGWLNTSEPLSDIKPDVMEVNLVLEENFDPSKYDFSESLFDLYGRELLIGTLVSGVCALTGVLVILKKKRS